LVSHGPLHLFGHLDVFHFDDGNLDAPGVRLLVDDFLKRLGRIVFI
jgi:hypothetical protein